MPEPIKPKALTHTEMMNGGCQQMDDAEHAREQRLQQGSMPSRRTLISWSRPWGIRTDHWMGVAAMQFQVEVLNPFVEWHLHTHEASLEIVRDPQKGLQALSEGKREC